jgi:type I restriction enzyme S subunit
MASGPKVIVGRKGSLGVQLAKGDFWTVDTAFWMDTFDTLDQMWAYYRLKVIDFKKENSGSAVPSLTREHFYSMPFALPPIPEQRKIAGVLAALDDLIEVNRELISTLKELVGYAYRLALTDAVSVPAGEVFDLKYGKALPARDRTPGRFPVVSSAGIIDTHREPLVSGPGVVVGRKGNVGSVTWVEDDFFPIDTTFYVETELPMLFAFLALNALGLSAMNTDSAVPGLNRENALRRNVKVLSEPDQSRLMNVIQPLWNAAWELEDENRNLSATRDELLPLILSGRIRVGEVAA